MKLYTYIASFIMILLGMSLCACKGTPRQASDVCQKIGQQCRLGTQGELGVCSPGKGSEIICVPQH